MKTIILDNIRVPVEKAFCDGLDNSIIEEAENRLGTADFKYEGLIHKSIDARHKNRINHVISAIFNVDDNFSAEKIENCSYFTKDEPEKLIHGTEPLNNRPVIAGSGPAGLFCAYILATYGYSPIVIERGDDIDIRNKKVKKLWAEGNLDSESNVQFGEGGAGTFSDGKLVTRINDPRCKIVIDIFLKNGAPAEIAYEAKPHIGTDMLKYIIKNIREEIIRLGGKFLFNSKLTDISIGKNLKSIRINDEYDIETNILILAIGHSARDTFELLFDKGIKMEQKPFSAGVRIEHLQESVDSNQWGESSKYVKGAADYAMHGHYNGRSAYTFCMCPGGVVVNASTEEKRLAINGMSYNSRKGKNANSAWVAEVWPRDMGLNNPLAGIEFQRQIEERAYLAGGGTFNAPVQKLSDFINGRVSKSFNRIRPSYTGETRFADLNQVLPDFIKDTLLLSIPPFCRKLGFFNEPDALLTGCETRTSSPVRILRTPDFQSISHPGIYPAGEGAGYAGGIMSAAVDGIKVAESIIKLYNYSG